MGGAPRGARRERWVWRYVRGLYLALPVPWVVSLLTDFNMRAFFLEGSPRLNAAYYWACFALGIVLRVRPRWTRPAVLGEHLLNFTCLIVAMWNRIYDPGLLDPDVLARTTPGITTSFLANFLVTGHVLAFVLMAEFRSLEGRWKGG